MSLEFYLVKLAEGMVGLAESFDELEIGESIQICRDTDGGYSYKLRRTIV